MRGALEQQPVLLFAGLQRAVPVLDLLERHMPDAVLYLQKEELKQIDFFLNYPVEFNGGHIRAVNTINPLTGAQVGPPQQACARSPVCGYPPQTVQEILGKVLHGKAKIVD